MHVTTEDVQLIWRTKGPPMTPTCVFGQVAEAFRQKAIRFCAHPLVPLAQKTHRQNVQILA